MSFLTDASLVFIPSGYKEDKAYSIKPTDGSGDLTFARASDGTRVNSEGYVERVPWNLLSNSQVFSLWNKVQIGSTVTVTDNFTTAPNGSLTAAKVVFSTFDGTAQIFQNYSLGTTQIYTSSLYAKVPSGTKQAYFGFYDGTSKVQLKTLTTEWQRIEYTGSINSGTVRACWFYGDGGASNVEVHLWGGQLNEGTLKPYFPTTNRQDVPRLDYSNGCPCLLLEPQRTNLVTYSEQFDNAAWSKLASTITVNTTTSPDGTQNADKLVEDTSSSAHRFISTNFSTTSGTTYTATIYAKQGERRYAYFRLNNSGGDLSSGSIDLQTGTITETLNGTLSASIDSNGWVRIVATGTSSSTSGGYLELRTSNSATYSNYTGDGTSGVYAWGAQVEAGSYPTSYIPTTSASVTRVADAASKTGISDLIGQSEGTFYGEVNVIPGITNMCVIARNSSGGTYGEYIALTFNSNKYPNFEVRSGNVQQVNITQSVAYSDGYHKIAGAYKENDFVLYVDGVQVGSDTSGIVPALNEIYLSQYIDGGIRNHTKKSFIVFPTRLTNDQLEYLTGNSYSTYATMASQLNYTIQ